MKALWHLKLEIQSVSWFYSAIKLKYHAGTSKLNPQVSSLVIQLHTVLCYISNISAIPNKNQACCSRVCIRIHTHNITVYHKKSLKSHYTSKRDKKKTFPHVEYRAKPIKVRCLESISHPQQNQRKTNCLKLELSLKKTNSALPLLLAKKTDHR